MFQQISFEASVEILTESNLVDVAKDENGRMGIRLIGGPFFIQRGDDNHLFLFTGHLTVEQNETVKAEIRRIVPALADHLHI